MPTYNHNSQQQDRVIVQEIQLAFSTHVKSKYPYYVGEGRGASSQSLAKALPCDFASGRSAFLRA